MKLVSSTCYLKAAAGAEQLDLCVFCSLAFRLVPEAVFILSFTHRTSRPSALAYVVFLLVTIVIIERITHTSPEATRAAHGDAVLASKEVIRFIKCPIDPSRRWYGPTWITKHSTGGAVIITLNRWRCSHNTQQVAL